MKLWIYYNQSKSTALPLFSRQLLNQEHYYYQYILITLALPTRNFVTYNHTSLLYVYTHTFDASLGRIQNIPITSTKKYI